MEQPEELEDSGGSAEWVENWDYHGYQNQRRRRFIQLKEWELDQNQKGGWTEQPEKFDDSLGVRDSGGLAGWVDETGEVLDKVEFLIGKGV